MAFMSITADEQAATIAAAIVGREQELFHYQLNIANYAAMLAVLPADDWPQWIAQYRGRDPASIEAIDMDTLQLVSDYAWRDRLQSLMRSENIEMGKARRVYDALRMQLPADQVEALVAAAKQRLTQTPP